MDLINFLRTLATRRISKANKYWMRERANCTSNGARRMLCTGAMIDSSDTPGLSVVRAKFKSSPSKSKPFSKKCCFTTDSGAAMRKNSDGITLENSKPGSKSTLGKMRRHSSRKLSFPEKATTSASQDTIAPTICSRI